MIIQDPKVRIARAEEKRRLLLRFLRDEIYTSMAVAALVMGCGPRAAEQTVKSMERHALVRRHRVKILETLPATPIIGITHHGQSMTFYPDQGELPMARVFEPSKYSLVGLQHHLDLQRTRVSLHGTDLVHGWNPGELLVVQKGQQRPDAVVDLSNGDRVAIEVERSLKSAKRYRAIASGHFGAFLSRSWDGVVYVCPDQNLANRVRVMFLQPWQNNLDKTDEARRFLNRVLFTTYENLISDFIMKFDCVPGL